MMKHFLLTLLTVSIVQTLVPAVVSADDSKDILIIVNERNPINRMKIDEVKNFFLKRKTRWTRGGNAVPVNVKRDTELRKDFLAKVMNMTPDGESTYWNQQKVKVGVSKPPEFSKQQKAVFKMKGALSYVYRGDFIKGVTKVVLVVPTK